MKAANGEESTDVVEMDAMDVVEWERDQHTPIAPDTNMAALVKQSAQPEAPPPVPPRTNTTRARTAMPVPLADKPAAGLPRATAPLAKQLAAEEPAGPSSRVPNATIPTPQPLMQQLLKTPTKHTTTRTPRLANETVPTPRAVQQNAIQQTVAKPAPAPAPAPPAEAPPSDGWEDLDDAWEEKPKTGQTNIDAKAYSAPAIARTATPNTVRRGDRKPSAAMTAQPAVRAPTKLGTEPLPVVAKPALPKVESSATAAKLVPRAESSATAKPIPKVESSASAAKRVTAARTAAKPEPVKPVAAKPIAPAKTEPPPRSSEPALLPPPPALVAAPADRHAPRAGAGHRDEDWDGLAPSKPSKPKPVVRPPRDFGDDLDDDGEPREPSVIIDLNAKPLVPPPDLDASLAAAALAADAIGGPGPQLPMQTSELSTTASGAFVMPTAASPGGRSIIQRLEPAQATGAAPKSSPAIKLPPPDPDDDLAIPVLAAPAWNQPAAAAVTPLPIAPAFPSAPAPLTYPKAQDAGAAWPPAAVAKPAGVAFAFAPATQQSAPPPRAPTSAELGWEHDPAIPQALASSEQTERRVAPRSLVATLLPTPKAKRVAAILAGAGACLVLLLVVISSGGKSGAEPAPATPPPATVAEVTPPPPPPAATAPAPAKPAEVAAVEPPAPVAEPVKPVAKPVVRRPARPAKPLVLDYDKPKADAKVAETADQALAKARAAYAAGNQHLFAGQADDAIRAYHQALAAYPNYVAGYRGLGLAYAQQGDRAAALKAFKTYVGLVPKAKDVALIQKRIARLSGQ